MARLVLALLLLVSPWSPARAAGPGWEPRLVEALARLEELPSQRCRAAWRTAEGTRSEGRMGWGEPCSPGEYREALAEWQAAAPGRHLPDLDAPVRVLNRFEAGKPLAGRFVGFDGPLLVLADQGREGLRHVAWRDLQVVDGAGRTLAGLDEEPERWPPSRRPLLEVDRDQRKAELDPRKLVELSLRERGVDDLSALALTAAVAGGFLLLVTGVAEANDQRLLGFD